ncbi:hypothetical protein FHX81_7880 [Saccharothrix saharensis]|uniref:Uncharacterized protein n=1 Tax=Saccharothrix saharensis TaxID=571190 RepID=A0A543JRD6_9PSEU|nr:hypothetical protein [Saccharothrix saharensis]TQM85400.1 hypothetical protein FHX81_7880 [Saccharothrix saharensis]
MRTAPAIVSLGLLLTACTTGTSGVPDPVTNEEVVVPSFVVVSGADGIAVVDRAGHERVNALGDDQPWSGPLAAALDAGSAAVVAGDKVAVVGPGRDPVVTDCVDCSGVAVTGGRIVTTRRNHTPGEGFDIVWFDRDLQEVRSLPVRRLEERDDGSAVQAENTESPFTLAADRDGVTVGYLSRIGGVRSGPSIIARYDNDGKIVRSTQVNGTLGMSATSPDRRHLAIGVGGSGGACITVSAPVVVDLDTLVVHPLEPSVPDGAVELGSPYPWFRLTDLMWRDGTVIATGEVHSPPEGESCDPGPARWVRAYDTATSALTDEEEAPRAAARAVGDSCADQVGIVGRAGDGQLIGVGQQSLGRYNRLVLGRPVVAGC